MEHFENITFKVRTDVNALVVTFEKIRKRFISTSGHTGTDPVVELIKYSTMLIYDSRVALTKNANIATLES